MSKHLIYATGTEPQSETVQAFIAKKWSDKPRIAWCEPVPTKTRHDNFPGLWFGASSPPNEALEEARLFWEDRWMHVVASPCGVRWAEFHVADAPPNDGKQSWPVVERSQKVLLLSDWRRYGLTKPVGWPDKVNVIEYHVGTTLVAWRLEVKA